jgi:hypothetical protein
MGMNGINVKMVIIAGKKARNILKEILAERIVVLTSEKATNKNEVISQRLSPPNP